MTTKDARDFADGLQERVTQMGDRTGEGQYLGQCLSIIRGLADQIDVLSPKAHGIVIHDDGVVDPPGTLQALVDSDPAPNAEEATPHHSRQVA